MLSAASPPAAGGVGSPLPLLKLKDDASLLDGRGALSGEIGPNRSSSEGMGRLFSAMVCTVGLCARVSLLVSTDTYDVRV